MAKEAKGKGAAEKKTSWVSEIRKIHRTKDPLQYAMPPEAGAKAEEAKKK